MAEIREELAQSFIVGRGDDMNGWRSVVYRWTLDQVLKPFVWGWFFGTGIAAALIAFQDFFIVPN